MRFVWRPALGFAADMIEVARLLNELVAVGVIERYALFGAVAQMRYTEAVATLDVDVLVSVPGGGGLGYLPEGEAIRVGDWPVQFIPAFNELTGADRGGDG